MSSFLYFMPGRGIDVTDEDIAAATGLAHAFEGRPATSEVREGPDGERGVLLADRKVEPSRFNYRAESQVWRKLLVSHVWVGMYKDNPPGPEDLAREQQLRGEWVELGDGEQWLVPLARGLSVEDDELVYHVALPSVRTLDDSGEWKQHDVVQRYAPLWDVASQYWDAVTGALAKKKAEDGKLTLDFEGETDAAVVALQANYRIGAVEASMLELLNDLTVGKILNATVDFDHATEWLKKKAAASGETTGDG